MNTDQIKFLVKQYPQVDVCFNSHGIKVGGKSTDQSQWVRLGWGVLSAFTLRRAIEKAVKSATKESPTLVTDEETTTAAHCHRHKGGKKETMGDKYVGKFCKKLSKRDAAELKDFVAFSIAHGYLPRDATEDDARDLCDVWEEKRK